MDCPCGEVPCDEATGSLALSDGSVVAAAGVMSKPSCTVKGWETAWVTAGVPAALFLAGFWREVVCCC
jgi:hypothetical protein